MEKQEDNTYKILFTIQDNLCNISLTLQNFEVTNLFSETYFSELDTFEVNKEAGRTARNCLEVSWSTLILDLITKHLNQADTPNC